MVSHLLNATLGSEEADMPRNPPWTMDETLRAFALYLSLTKRERNDKANPHILELSRQTGRTPSSVYMKLANISAYDPNTIEEGNVGLPHGGKKDAEVWDMWREQGDALLERAGAMLPDETREGLGLTPAEALIAEYERNPVGGERMTIVSTRVNQSYFRNSLLENYENRCCLTGISVPQLLVASHIKPWAVADPETERLDASNGLLLNALHDRAFDKGLITVDFDGSVVVSPKVRHDNGGPNDTWLWAFEGRRMAAPRSHAPGRDYLEYHHDVIFQR